jgi:CIC family chloride channel protein
MAGADERAGRLLWKYANVKWLRRLWRPGSQAGLMLLAVLTGVGAGLGAVLLIKSIEGIRWLVDRFVEVTTLERSWVFLAIPVALVVSWLVTSRFAPEVAGHGVPQIIAALAIREGSIRPRVVPLKVAATAITIGAGGSAGREGSIAQIGAALGSWFGRVSPLGENDVRVLVAAGAGAGISATFNAPIAGMFFAMEVILGSFSVRHLNTVVVASVAGAVTSGSILGESLTFSVPAYRLSDPKQLVLYAALGVIVVATAWVFLAALDLFEVVPGRFKAWIRPLLLAGVVASLGFAYPDLLGTGQQFIGGVLRNEVAHAWWLFAILAVLKAIATAATLGGRGSGGIFMPSLFMGAAIGAGFALLISPYWPLSTIQPGAFALVGMAATFAAVARAPLTSILIVFEVTGDYGLVLPLMIATSIATFLAGRVRPESAYTAPLRRMGINSTPTVDIDLLDTVAVGDVTVGPVTRVAPEATLGEVQGVLRKHRVGAAPVTKGSKLVGIVSESDIMRAGGPSDQVTAADVMTPTPVTVPADTPVSDVLERMVALGVGQLPVVASDDPDRLVGLFRREDVAHAYHWALGTATRDRHVRDRFRARSDAYANFFEFEVPVGSVADGRPVHEVPWPEGCLLVSVFRGQDLVVPSGTTRLRAGDAILAFAAPDARDRLIERLKVGTGGQQAGGEPSS